MSRLLSRVCFRALGPALSLGVFAIACSGGVAASPTDQAVPLEQASDEALEAPAPPPGAPEGDAPPPRPPLCKSDADCDASCPPEAKGCACHAVPGHDQSVCVPTCNQDSDCPAPPGAPQLRCNEGVCAPPPPPPKPAACTSDADCGDACPPGAKGCACRSAPELGKVCVPACSTDADCPKLPGGPPLACHDGACAPPPPPKPPTR